ncbi:MAG: class I SAM-dependent methyltransferase [archaeon]|nr:class I SAM-dependent methyltransferase [archaeon]
MDTTVGFYDGNSEAYSKKTFGADLSELRSHLVRHLPEGASVLDLGCGSGRDSLAFSRMGYRVTAMDASEGMCRMTERNTGIRAEKRRYQDLDRTDEFDGVWACCSLLHCPSDELPDVLGRVRRSLKKGGVFFCCFKKGDFEGEREGRHYLDLDVRRLGRLLEDAGFEIIELWEEKDFRGDLFWTNAVSRVRV